MITDNHSAKALRKECCAVYNLKIFQVFLIEEFLKGKELTVTNIKPWQDFDSKEILGVKVEVAITKDDTVYPAGRDGNVMTNLFEKLTFKVPKNSVDVKANDIVTPVHPVASIYGDYQNQLSITADDVVAVKNEGAKK